jgi:2-methylisocitrate lyase-like PEP mutase family enzyme
MQKAHYASRKTNFRLLPPQVLLLQAVWATRMVKGCLSGADGIFLPCISAEDDIAIAVSNTALPLNVMCIPGLPDFDALSKPGVKRASMGPFLFNKVYDNIGRFSREIGVTKSFSPIL